MRNTLYINSHIALSSTWFQIAFAACWLGIHEPIALSPVLQCYFCKPKLTISPPDTDEGPPKAHMLKSQLLGCGAVGGSSSLSNRGNAVESDYGTWISSSHLPWGQHVLYYVFLLWWYIALPQRRKIWGQVTRDETLWNHELSEQVLLCKFIISVVFRQQWQRANTHIFCFQHFRGILAWRISL